ncbi:uncharacterized protein LOC135359291 [Latimeria chalumnae]|uniref:uncharacterized protein LOC135359291 n=1 Tax=Latimeria chalumnae TaxID=7897 RepID=UPI00313B2D3E
MKMKKPLSMVNPVDLVGYNEVYQLATEPAKRRSGHIAERRAKTESELPPKLQRRKKEERFQWSKGEKQRSQDRCGNPSSTVVQCLTKEALSSQKPLYSTEIQAEESHRKMNSLHALYSDFHAGEVMAFREKSLLSNRKQNSLKRVRVSALHGINQGLSPLEKQEATKAFYVRRLQALSNIQTELSRIQLHWTMSRGSQWRVATRNRDVQSFAVKPLKDLTLMVESPALSSRQVLAGNGAFLQSSGSSGKMTGSAS